MIIYHSDNSIAFELESYNEGSRLVRKLMSDDYIVLPFTSQAPVDIRIGDYLDVELSLYGTIWRLGRYVVTERQKADYNTNTGCYDYNLRMESSYMAWKNRRVKYSPRYRGSELSFSLTSTIATHLDVIIENLSVSGFTYFGTDYVAAFDSNVDVNVAKAVKYDNLSILDALTTICKTFDAEWWVTDNIIHVGKCDLANTPDNMEIGNNVSAMTMNSNGKTLPTRIYAFGSDRNLPSTYRQNTNPDLTISAVIQRRLALPDSNEVSSENLRRLSENGLSLYDGYIQYVDVTQGNVVEEVFVNDDIYPKTECFVLEPPETYTDSIEEEDGTIITRTYYRIKDGSGFVFDNSMILSNQTLHILFQSGKMNGMDFECKYDEANGYYEVIANESYGRFLPDTNLHPETNDRFVLYNWDSTKISGTGLIQVASNELLGSVIDYIIKGKTDPNEYSVTEDATEEDFLFRDLGERINLINPALFQGGKIARIVGVEMYLDLPYDHPKYTVSENSFYVYQGHVEGNTEELTFNGQSYSGINLGGGSSVYVIKANDMSTPTDTNVFSARRSLREFLSKKNDDTAEGLITFRKGFQSSNFRPGDIMGAGFGATLDQGGISTIEVDKLIVRMKAFFAELEIREVSYLGGNYVFSAAGSRIYYVEWLDSEGEVLDKETAAANIAQFRCFLYSDDGMTATINKWAVDDQARCQTFNIDAGVHQNVTNKFYWRRVSSIGKMAIPSKEDDAKQYQYIVFDNVASDCLSGSDFPEAGDAIAQMGNWTNRSRQGIIYLDLEGTNAPAIMEYSGVGEQHFVLPDPTLMLSPKKNIIYGEFHSVVDGQTTPETIDEQLQELIEALNDVKSQSDQKFDVWFGQGKPLPSKDNPTATANSPAFAWTTDDLKALHVQDIYYDTTREPASNGGRAWRWVAAVVDGSTTYYWEDITDSDTLAALEKISDVASDGKLTGGAEKVRVYIDWMRCVREYAEYTEQAEDYGISTAAYTAAMLALFNLLNASELTALPNPIPTPSWLADLTTTTVIPSPSDYRAAWDNYYNALAALLAAISDAAYTAAEDAQQAAEAAQLIIDDIVADNKLDPSEKQTIKREFVASLHEMIDTDDSLDRPGLPAGIIDRAKNDQGAWVVDYNTYVKPYEDAFVALGTYLNGDVAWAIPTLTAFLDVQLNVVDSVLPEWIQEDGVSVEHISRTETIVADVFRKKWSDFFSARTSLLTALTKNAQQTADDAQQDIDTIASDSILSRVEKKEVRKEWEALVRTRAQNLALAAAVNLSSLPSSQQGGYGEGGTAILNAYNTAFINLGKYMNGDFEEDTTSQWDTTSVPSWISDAQMDVDQPIVPATYRSYWYAYYESEIKVLNAIAAMTKSESERAMQAIVDIAADGIVTPSEKDTLILQWNAVISELPPLLLQADANKAASAKTSTEEKQLVTTARTAYINAFQNLADFMNGGNTYVWNYTTPKSFPTLAWFNANNKGNNETVVTSTFTGLWSTYFDTRNALQKLIVDISRRPGDDALDELYDLASDGKLTAAEKLTVVREWLAINEEYEDLQAKAIQCHADVTPLRAAYNVLSNYLDNLSVETADSSDYQNEDQQGNVIIPRDINNPVTSDVNAELFNERWTAYYSARSNLLATSLSKPSWFVGVDVPTPPYKVGDLWMKLAVATDVTGVMMICIQSRDTAPGSLSDWTPYSNVATDISLLMSALVIKAYQYVGEDVEDNNVVRVRLGSGASSNYDLAYNNSHVYWREGGLTDEISDERLQIAMANVMEVIGAKDFRISKNKLTTPAQYDIVAKPITFTDPNLPVGSEYRTVKGGLEILMYDGRQWIVLQESTRNLMESLPGYMRFVVFGSDDGTLESSGIMLKQDFATMFSEAVSEDDDIVKRAEVSTFVKKNATTGVLESTVKIGGDQIIMEGKTIINNKFEVDDDGSVTLTDLTVNGNSTFHGDVNLSGTKYLSVKDTSGNERVRIKAEEIDTTDAYLSQSIASTPTTDNVSRTDGNSSTQNLLASEKTISLNNGNSIVSDSKIIVKLYIASYLNNYPVELNGNDITVRYSILKNGGVYVVDDVSNTFDSQTGLLGHEFVLPTYTTRDDAATYQLIIHQIQITSITSGCSLYGETGSVQTHLRVYNSTEQPVKTVIAQNGIVVNAGVDKWMYISSDEMSLRFGNSGVRLSGTGMQVLRKSLESGNVWVSETGVTRIVGNNYSVDINDVMIVCQNNADITVTLPLDCFYEGHRIAVRRAGSGNVTLAVTSGRICKNGERTSAASMTIDDYKTHVLIHHSYYWYEQ